MLFYEDVSKKIAIDGQLKRAGKLMYVHLVRTTSRGNQYNVHCTRSKYSFVIVRYDVNALASTYARNVNSGQW